MAVAKKKAVAKKATKKKLDPMAQNRAMFGRMDSDGDLWGKVSKGKNKGKRSPKAKKK